MLWWWSMNIDASVACINVCIDLDRIAHAELSDPDQWSPSIMIDHDRCPCCLNNMVCWRCNMKLHLHVEDATSCCIFNIPCCSNNMDIDRDQSWSMMTHWHEGWWQVSTLVTLTLVINRSCRCSRYASSKINKLKNWIRSVCMLTGLALTTWAWAA